MKVLLPLALFSVVLAVNGDKGLGVDPNGGLRAATADQGPMIDPNGRGVHAAATTDDGIGIDPNGGLRH